LETGERLRVWGYVFGQKLQSNKAPEFRILSFADDTHTAAAQLLDNAVVRNGLTDQWPESYVDETGQVNESGGVDGALQRGSLASRASVRGYVPARDTISTKCTESRADHGLENFGGSLYPYERDGRHVGTRTSDLYRVKSRTCQRWGDTKEVGLAWRGNVHAGPTCPPAHYLYPCDNERNVPTRVGMAGLRHKARHKKSPR
jgi:hypothetical protein